MARKSKQPGGHNPLTAHEVKRLKFSGYGTQTTRLSTASHLPFGQCCLSLSPISTHGGSAAVATPSGHVYSREAMVRYLLTKNVELRSRKAEYDRLRSVVENRRAAYEEKQRSVKRTTFLTKDQGAMNGNNNSATTALVLREDRQTNDTITTGSSSSTFTPLNNSKRVENSLSHVSYWLASSQPSRANKRGGGDDDDVNDITEFDYLREIEALPPLPPSRPSSPMSGESLRLKQLIPLHLLYEGDGSSNSNEYDDDTKSSSSSVSLTNNTDRRRQQQQQSKKRGGVICSVSHKVITTQPIIALHGHVMLRDMYEQYALPTLTCPITGRKFNVRKDVIELVAGRSGYAASGMVVAKKYNPTLT